MIQKIAGRLRSAQLKVQAAKREKKRQRLIEQPGEPVTQQVTKQNTKHQIRTELPREPTPPSPEQVDELTPGEPDELTLEELDEPFAPESIQGKPVHLVANGTVKIRRSALQQPLRFRLSTAKAKEILVLKEIPCLYLTLEAVQLCVQKTVVYERSIERLLMSEQREEWMLQVLSELETLGGSIPGPNAFVGNEKWMRTEFRNKLLGGSDFHFKDQVSTVQLIVIRIPEAIGDTIFLQGELVPARCEHPDWCCTSHQADDPGRRLGIKVRYSTKQGMVEQWYKLGGKKNAAKLNSLVDVLEGREREWTAQQPRRCLKGWGGKKMVLVLV